MIKKETPTHKRSRIKMKTATYAMANNPQPAPDAVAWIKITTCAQMKFAAELLARVDVDCKKFARVPMHGQSEIEGAIWVTNPEDTQMIISAVWEMSDAGLLEDRK
jgi:hypothetical protein